MSLAVFIKTHENQIIEEWEAFAKTCSPAADEMDTDMQRDYIRGLLRFIASDIMTPQTEAERDQKGKGKAPKAEGKDDSAAETHGEERFRSGFDLMQLHAEFRALRASVLKLWTNEWTKSNRDWQTPADVIPDLMRFNEAIDQMFSESLKRYLREENSKIKRESDSGSDRSDHALS